MSSNEDAGEPAQKRSRVEDVGRSRWSGAAQTPRQMANMLDGGFASRLGGATPTPSAVAMADGRTPLAGSVTPSMGSGLTALQQDTPTYGSTPLYGGQTPAFGANSLPMATPNYMNFGGATPLQSTFSNSAKEKIAAELRKEWHKKNSHLTDEALDAMIPSDFVVLPPPVTYAPLEVEEPNFLFRASQMPETVLATVTEVGGGSETEAELEIPDDFAGPGMPPMEPQDKQVFAILLQYHGVRDEDVPQESLPGLFAMRNLFKIKNGTDVSMRRSATRALLDKAKVLTPEVIFKLIFRIWGSQILNVLEKRRFLELMKSLVVKFQEAMKPVVQELIQLLRVVIADDLPEIRDDARVVVVAAMRSVGIEATFSAVKDDLVNHDVAIRRHTAKIVAVMALAFGPEEALMILGDIARSEVESARYTAARSLTETALILGHGMTKHLNIVQPILERLIVDARPRVKTEAASALSHVADACSPYGIDSFAPLMVHVRDECRKGVGTSAANFLRAFGSIVPLMQPAVAQAFTEDIMPTLVNLFSTPEAELQRTLMNVVRKCVECEGVHPEFVRRVIVQPFLAGFWSVRRIAGDRKSYRALVETTTVVAQKVGGLEVLTALAPLLNDDNVDFQNMAVEAMDRVVSCVGTLSLGDDLVRRLVDGALAAWRFDAAGTNHVVLEGACTLVNKLGDDSRLKPYLQKVFELLKEKLGHSTPEVRKQSAEGIAKIAKKAGAPAHLLDFGRQLFMEIKRSDQPAIALSSMLKGLRAIIEELTLAKFAQRKDLLQEMRRILKVRDNFVQLHAVKLLYLYTSQLFSGDVQKEEDELRLLLSIATDSLLHILDAERRETRQACAEAFGIIAQKLQAGHIVLKLIENFNQEAQKIRVQTAIALSVIAKHCGPFVIVPFLMNEYRECEGHKAAQIVQHSVLKTIRFMFEYTGNICKDYVMPFVPLLERALTELKLTDRRLAIEAARAVVMAIVGEEGFHDVVVHLLNLVHPNIVELQSGNKDRISDERKAIIVAVVDFYEAARLVLGSAVMYQYLIQGVFHSAAKVREIFRKSYNLIYYANPEALIPCHPKIDDEENFRYTRHELYTLL